MTIPSSEIVQATPSVLAAGGGGVSTIALFLSGNTRIPIGTVAQFPSAIAVDNFFGSTAHVSSLADIYFEGFENATQSPGLLKVAQFPQVPVSAYLRGGNLSALTLPQLQALSGTLLITMDGYARDGGTVSLAAATSPSNAASIIQTALNAAAPQQASFTGSIADTTSDFTASIGGHVMAVTSVASGQVIVGGTIAGGGVSAGTTVTAQLSGVPGGIGTYGVSIAQTATSTAIVETVGTLSVSVVASGALQVGQTVGGSGVAAGSVITALGNGSGGTGTYYLSTTGTIGSESLTTSATALAVTYNSQSGAFIATSGVVGSASTAAFATGTLAAGLEWTQATGAVLSQGANPQTPAAFMNALIQVDNDWVIFQTDFDPDQGSGNAQKQAFAAWKNTQTNKFAYACEDDDSSPATTVPAIGSLGYILANDNDSGTCLCWEPSSLVTANGWGNLSSFVCGITAAIAFQQNNGRITYAFKAQAGFTAGVSDPTTAQNLGGNPQVPDNFGNGYNFYGAYANAGQNNIWFQRGFVTGPWQWINSYIFQIWFTNLCQNALLAAFGSFNSIPFTAAGNSILEQVLIGTPDEPGPILQALAFGMFGPGTITAQQAAQINQAVGPNAANTISSQGWLLQIVSPTALVKQSRGPLQIKIWYLDNGDVQSAALSVIGLIG